MDSVREYLGGRYGGAWINNYDDGTRSFTIAVVEPTDTDRSKTATLAGKYHHSVELVQVKYAREDLLVWHKQISNSFMGTPRDPGTRTLVATNNGFYVFAGIGWDPRQNKVVIWTAGKYVPEQSVDSSPIVAEVPASVPPDAYVIDTNRVVSILSPAR
ncbi:MAG TPA: hypothetical protein VK277_17460 [Acidimicrobiales bacterium]|nr:hypothetical protein [Acidimicrobiales bacterium]